MIKVNDYNINMWFIIFTLILKPFSLFNYNFNNELSEG